MNILILDENGSQGETAHPLQKYQQVGHRPDIVYDQQEMFTGLFEFGLIRMFLQIFQYQAEDIRFKIRRVRPVDKITAQVFIFKDQPLKPKADGYLTDADGVEEVLDLWGNRTKPVDQLGM